MTLLIQYHREILNSILKIETYKNPRAGDSRSSSSFGAAPTVSTARTNGKKRTFESQGGRPDGKKPSVSNCFTCGRNHAGHCTLKGKTWANSEPVPWAESTKGKEWLAKGHSVCPYERDLPRTGELYFSSGSPLPLIPCILNLSQGTKEDVEAKALVDSGASDNFLSRELVREWGWNVISNATLIRDAFGETVTSEGSIALEIRLISESEEEIRRESSFLVIESPIQIILGRESIKEWELVRHFPSHFCLPREKRKTDFEREDIEEIGDDYLQAIPPEFLQGGEEVLTLPTNIQGPPELQRRLRELVNEFQDRFSNKISAEPANLETFVLEVNDELWERPENHLSPRKMDRTRADECRRQVEEMLAADIIQVSRASHYSHALMVPKSNGKFRFCVDFKNLNKATHKEGWPIPNIPVMLRRVGEHRAKYFIVLDLTCGYFQVPISPESRRYTAFITQFGLFEWKRLPMGLKGAPAFFQRVISTRVLVGYLMIICELYLDDLIIFARTIEQLVESFRKILLRFREYNILINPEKCRWGLSEVTYVGHTVNSDGLHFTRERLEGVKDFKLPLTQKGLKSFLGLTNYFHDHVAHLSEMVRPLNKMLTSYEKTRRIEWTEEGKRTFELIKRAINECPRLFFLDDESPVRLYTDASDIGVGAHLVQVVDGKENSIGFISKAFDQRMQNWDVPQKEGYAIFFALEKWEYLLRDRYFTVYTDHLNLTRLKTDYQKDKKVQRWLRCFQGFDMDIRSIKGSDNVIADAFSRLCVLQRENDGHEVCHHQSTVTQVPATEEKDDGNDATGSLTSREQYEVFSSVHNDTVGHFGVEKTLKRMKKNGCRWPGMRRIVREFIAHCPCCQKNDQRRSEAICRHPFSLSSADPMKRLYVDLIEDLRADEEGYRHILVVIDAFSRYLMLYPLKEKTSMAVAKAMLSLVGEYGTPDQIVSDRGPCFVSDVCQELFKLLGAEHVLTMAHSKEENGMVERANKEVLRHLRNIIFDRSVLPNWSVYLPLVQRIHNASEHSTTGVAPAKVIFGNSIDLDRNILVESSECKAPGVYMEAWVDTLVKGQEEVIRIVRENLRVQKERQEATGRDEMIPEFPVGTYVLVEHVNNLRRGPKSKLLPFLKGPLRVVRVEGDRYTLFNLLTGREKDYHVRRLREYHYDPQTLNPLLAACKDDGSIYPVDSITKMRGNRRVERMVCLFWSIGLDSTHLRGNLGGMSADLSLSINTSAVIGMRSVGT